MISSVKPYESLRVPVLRPSGIVGEIYGFIMERARFPQPLFAIAGALCIFGAILSRRVRSDHGQHPNLYCISAAPTSSGKNLVLELIEEILYGLGKPDLVGCEDVASDAAIERDIKERGAILYPWDEVGHSFASFSPDSRTCDPNARRIVPMLTKLWSKANGRFQGKSRASRDDSRAASSIQFPCVSLYGTGTPKRIADSLNFDQIEDGWLPRCLYFFGDYTERQIPSNRPMSPALFEQLKAWADFVPQVAEGKSIVEDGAAILDIPVDANARAKMNSYSDECRELVMQEGQPLNKLWGKASEHVERVALIVACGRAGEPDAARISIADVQYAIGLVDFAISGLRCFISGNVAHNDIHRKSLQIENYIKSHADGVALTDINRDNRGIDAKERQKILRDLVNSGVVEDVPTPTKGRPKIKYYHLDNLADHQKRLLTKYKDDAYNLATGKDLVAPKTT